MTYPKPEFNKRYRWFLKEMRVQDWIVDLVLRNDPPPDCIDLDLTDTLGACWPHESDKEATIWISPSRCVAAEENPFHVLFHELLHMICEDIGLKKDEAPRTEFVWDRMSAVLEKAYLADRPARKRGRRRD